MLEFLADQSVLIFFVVFIIFIVVAYKLVKFLFKAFIVGLVAALFPVAGNLLFGLDIAINLSNMIWFAGTGIILFLAYSAIRMGWGALKLVTKPFRWLFRRTKKKNKES